PGVQPIMSYLQALPYPTFNNGNCDSNHWYQLNNDYPNYTTMGTIISNQDVNEFPAGPAFSIGPQTIPTVGDALSAHNISWRYYGGGFSVASNNPPSNSLYCAICNGFQYATSIMTTSLRQNLVDLEEFYTDVATNQLPAVSFLKPDVLLDGHPGTSTPALFEAFVRKIVRIFRLTARRLVISERCSRFRAQLRRLALLPRPVDPERKNAVRLFDFPWGAPNPSFTIAMRRVFISLNIQRHARKSLLHS